MMKENKNELRIALICIVAYVISLSVADNFSASIGIIKSITLPVSVIFAVILLSYIAKQKQFDYYGFRSMKKLPHKELLFYIPFIIITTVNLWNGVSMRATLLETILYILSMCCVGIIEEVLFRGLLFRAMAKDNVKSAIIVSSITFGLGHIVNLLNGAEFLPTILQLFYAVAIGFMFTVFVYKTGNIIPCVLCHGILNSLSVFSVEPSSNAIRIIISIVLSLISLLYAWYLYKRNFKNAESEVNN